MRPIPDTTSSAFAVATARRYRSPPPDLAESTLAGGSSGVAYFLMRQAGLDGGQESLDAAERWAAHAERSLTQTPEQAEPSSIFVGEPGVWWVRAMVAAARSDDMQAHRATVAYVNAVEQAMGEETDLFLGSAGLVLGCAQLIESLTDGELIEAVRDIGQRHTDRLVAMPESELDFLGLAHGWGGIALALLRWSQATEQAVPPEALSILERLAQQRRPSGRWPVRAGSREVWTGWCHGSAGWAQLWTLAWQLVGDEDLLGFATACADDAINADGGPLSLCCGRAGKGFAALALLGATGDDRWRVAAQNVVLDVLRGDVDKDNPDHSLFRGRLGLALLAAELTHPDRTSMPLVQAIR